MSDITRIGYALVVSDNFLAELVSKWSIRRWAIWKIADILNREDAECVFYAQSQNDAAAMIECFERAMRRAPETVLASEPQTSRDAKP